MRLGIQNINTDWKAKKKSNLGLKMWKIGIYLSLKPNLAYLSVTIYKKIWFKLFEIVKRSPS